MIGVVGPTGSGKSALALFLAHPLDAEILNCDSLQIYRHFDIGTAKLAPAARRGIVHHLIDLCEPDEVFTAGDYARLARQTLRQVAARGRVPIVVGGTGFYLRALLDGLAPSPSRDAGLRERLLARDLRRPGSLHRLLRRFDPERARSIHPNDRNKLIRAVEVCLLARRPVTTGHQAGADPLHGFDIHLIGLDPPRAGLYEVLNQRLVEMFQTGLLEEVRALLDRFPSSAKPFESIGYREAVAVVRGEITLEAAIVQAQTATRNYAKRQWTWFKKDTRVSWIPGFGHSPQTQAIALETLLKSIPPPTVFF